MSRSSTAPIVALTMAPINPVPRWIPSWGSSQLPIKAPTIRSIRHSKQGIGSRVSEPRSMHSTPPLLKRQGEPKTSSAAGDGNSQQECD